MQNARLTTLMSVAMIAACNDPGAMVGPNVSALTPSLATGSLSDPAPIVVFSNFGPNKSFDASNSYTINGFLSPEIGQQTISQQFTPSVNGRFASAEVAAIAYFGAPSIRVVLQADANGLPGQVMEDIPLQGIQTVAAVISATSSLRSDLRVGSRYWLTVVAGAAGAVGGWNFNSIGDVATGNMAVTGAGTPLGPWGPLFGLPRAAFAISVTPPTPQDVLRFAVDAVSRLVGDGSLSQGEGNALVAKLSGAIASLDRDNLRAACGQLGAVLNQADALMTSGRLTSLQAQPLRDLTRATSRQLGCD